MPFSGAERDCHRAVTAVWPTDALVEVSADFTEGVHLERGEPDAKEGLQSSCDTPLDLRGPAPSLKDNSYGATTAPAAQAHPCKGCGAAASSQVPDSCRPLEQSASTHSATTTAAAEASQQQQQQQPLRFCSECSSLRAAVGAAATVESVSTSRDAPVDRLGSNKGQQSDHRSASIASSSSDSTDDHCAHRDDAANADVRAPELLMNSTSASDGDAKQQHQQLADSDTTSCCSEQAQPDLGPGGGAGWEEERLASHHSCSSSIRACGIGQPGTNNNSSSSNITTGSGSGNQGSSGTAGSNGGAAAGSGISGVGGSSSGGLGAGGSSGEDGNNGRRPGGAFTPSPVHSEAIEPDNNSSSCGTAAVDQATAAAAAGTAEFPGVGCSTSDPVVLPGSASLGTSPGSLRLLASPASLSINANGSAAGATRGAGSSQQTGFSFPAALPYLDLSSVNGSVAGGDDGGGGGGMSSLADALLSPLAASSGASGPSQQQLGHSPAYLARPSQYGSLDPSAGPSFPGFSATSGRSSASPLTAGRRASDVGPSAAAAAAAAWNVTQLQLQQQAQALQQQAVQQQLRVQQQQQMSSLGGGSWSGLSPSILALEQELQQLHLMQQQQQQQLLSPAGSGSIQTLSPMMSGNYAQPGLGVPHGLGTPLLSPTRSLGILPLPPQQHSSQRPPLLPSHCSAPSSRDQVTHHQPLATQLHLFNPGLMGLIGSNDPGLGVNYSAGPLSMSSSDNLLTWLSNDEFSRSGLLSAAASETDAAALARAAAALSGTGMIAQKFETNMLGGQAMVAALQGAAALDQQQRGAEARPAAVDVGDGGQANQRDQNALVAAAAATDGGGSKTDAVASSVATGADAATIRESEKAAAAGGQVPAGGSARAVNTMPINSSSMTRAGSSNSSVSGTISTIAHSLSGESLPDLEEMKARSASFAAALAEAEAIAAEVNMSMEAAKQQQAATAAAEVSAAGSAINVESPAAPEENVASAAPAESSSNAAYDPAELTKGRPSRHLWLGNLHQRLPRSVLRGVFENFGAVDDVVTFPGRMYAFVNFKEAADAAKAAEDMQAKEVPLITGNRHLVVKFRPSRRALGKVLEAMVPGLVEPAAAAGSTSSSNAGSTGNLAAEVAVPVSPALQANSSGLAWLAAAAVSASGSGPDSNKSAAAALRTTSDTADAGAMQKAAVSSTNDSSSVPAAAPDANPTRAVGSSSSSSCSLGSQLDQLLPHRGSTDPDTAPQLDQTVAAAQHSASFSSAAAAAAAVAAAAAAVASSSTDSNAATAAHVAAAAAALAAVDPGMPQGPNAGGESAGGDDVDIPEGKPSRHLWLGNIPLKPNRAGMESLFSRFGPLESVRVFPGKTFAFVNFVHAAHAITAKSALDGQPSPHITGPKPLVIRFQKDTAGLPMAQVAGKAPDAAAARARKSLGRTSLTGSVLLPGGAGVVCSDEDLVAEPAVNLSNKLNPNNIHYDRELAARYKRMSKSEKESLWAQDRAMQQLEHNPAAASMLSAAAMAAAAAAGQASPGAMFDPLLHQQQQQAAAAAAAGSLYSQLWATNPQLAAAAALQQGPGGAAGLLQRPGWNPSAAYQQAVAALHAQGLGHLAMDPTAIAAAAAQQGLGGMYGGGAASTDLQQYLAATGMGTANSNLLQHMAGCLPGQQDPNSAVTAALHHDSRAFGALGLCPSTLHAHLGGGLTAGGGVVPASPGRATALSGPHSHSGSAAPTVAHHRRVSYPGAPEHSPQPQHPHQLGRLSAGWGQSGYSPVSRSISNTGSGFMGTSTAAAAGIGGGINSLSSFGPASANSAADAGSWHQHQQQQQQPRLSSTWGGLDQPAGPSSTSSQLPHHYMCPLTQRIMSDPVTAADGITYDRPAIIEWMRVRDVSPVTGLPLGSAMLQPNYQLRQAIATDMGQLQGPARGY